MSEKQTYIPDNVFIKEYTKRLLKEKKLKQENVKYNGKDVKLYDPQYLPVDQHKTKKMEVYIRDPKSKKIDRITFGHKDYSDYTLHRNKKRQENYCARSAGIKCEGENCDMTSPNFWSRYILWNC